MKLLITLLLALTVFTSQAQHRRYAKLPLATHADSVALIRQVFKHERRFGRLLAAASGFVVGSNIANIGSPRVNQSTSRQVVNFSLIGIYGFLAGQDIVRWHRFSKRREAEAIIRFELHQPQPLYVQRQLVVAFQR